MWKGNLGKALLTHKIANTIFGPTLGAFLITATMTVTTAIALHFITITDGTVQERDKSNVPYVTEENMKNSSISNDGKVNTEYNAQEIWDGLIQNNSRISQYLDGPNELKKLMNAELITKYLDTRPDPNEPIDWNSINSNSNSTEVQGIIKLKRAMEEDKVETMVYADMGTLQGYIDLSNTEPTMEIPTTIVKANGIDIDAIYKNVYKLPVDAYYKTDPYVVYPSSNGLDFAISIDEAKNMIATYQEEYTIPLKVLYPNVTTNQIGDEAFPDKLSSFSTSYKTSSSYRSTNIALAAQKIDGIVLMPGEIFSFNQTVGERTKAAGFKEATAYSGGKVVQEVGGGICQVSSTLYNAVLYSNLEIVERTNHGFEPSYVKPGLDATVSWGGPDFKFKNNRDYPIRIKTDTSSKILKIYIYGLKKDTDYKVVLDSEYVASVPYKTIYQKDSSLKSGQSKVIQSGSNGCKTVAYKYLYDSNGTLVSSECLSRDTYNPHNKIIAVGN